MNRQRRSTTFVSSFLGPNNIAIFTMTCYSEHGKRLNIDWTFAVLPRVTTLRYILRSFRTLRAWLQAISRCLCLAHFSFSEPFCRRETPEELCGHTVYHFWQGWAYRRYDVNTLSTYMRMCLKLRFEFLLKASVNNSYISVFWGQNSYCAVSKCRILFISYNCHYYVIWISELCNIYTYHCFIVGDKIKKNELSWACGGYGWGEGGV